MDTILSRKDLAGLVICGMCYWQINRPFGWYFYLDPEVSGVIYSCLRMVKSVFYMYIKCERKYVLDYFFQLIKKAEDVLEAESPKLDSLIGLASG